MDDKELKRIKRNKYMKEYRNKNKEKFKKDREENKEHYKQWRIKNKDKIKSKSKIYYEKNKVKILNYNKEYNKDNKNKLKENNIQWRLKNKEKIKQSSKKSYQKYYQNNKDKINISNNEYRKLHKIELSKYRQERKLKIKQFITEYKNNHKCSKCSEVRSVCLEFHHLGDKTYSISYIVRQGYSLKTIKKEIDKCFILCGNCHRKEHFKKYHITSTKQRYVNDIKLRSKCCFCAENTPCCLSFHHLNPEDKITNINTMEGSRKYSLNDLKNEIQKCILVCTNCHKLLHANQLSLPEDVQPIKLDITPA